jgi:hypothetical protein
VHRDQLPIRKKGRKKRESPEADSHIKELGYVRKGHSGLLRKKRFFNKETRKGWMC